MQRLKFWLLGVGLAVIVALVGFSGGAQAAETAPRTLEQTPNIRARFAALALLVDDDDDENKNKGGGRDEKNKKDKDNKPAVNRGASGGAGGRGGATFGNGAGPRPGIAAWWRNFRARLLGATAEEGGWQSGRFKDAFPFAHPTGWQVRDRGDALVMTGPWQNSQYVFQLTRSITVDAQSLEDWVNRDLDALGVSAGNVRYGQSGNVQIAVAPGVREAEDACPVAYVYLWVTNPAGRNVRQAMGVISQAPGETCSAGGLSSLIDAYLTQIGAAALPTPIARPPATTPAPTAGPTRPAPTATPARSGWQQTRFFNAFSFAYPDGWTMDRLGDSAHLQGEHEGREYVVDMVWIRNAPQLGLEQWARADLGDLNVNLEGLRFDYVTQNDGAQVAVVGGVRMQGYDCPIVRMYVLANNAAGGGQRAYIVTVAQTNGQPCDVAAIENLAYKMLQQA